jgi:hypothetical protein
MAKNKVVGYIHEARWPLSGQISIRETVSDVLRLVRKQFNNDNISINLLLISDPALEGLLIIIDGESIVLSYIAGRLPIAVPSLYFYFTIPIESAK